MVGMLRRALAVMATIRCVWAARSSVVTTFGSCNCTSPITTPFGVLFNPPSALIWRSRYLVMLNSPGMSRIACFEPADAIMMNSVRM